MRFFETDQQDPEFISAVFVMSQLLSEPFEGKLLNQEEVGKERRITGLEALFGQGYINMEQMIRFEEAQ